MYARHGGAVEFFVIVEKKVRRRAEIAFGSVSIKRVLSSLYVAPELLNASDICPRCFLR